MEKDKIGRYDLKDNIMNSIFFRIDYQGIISIDAFIDEFVKKFKGTFTIFERVYNNRVDLFLTSYQEISESLSLPVKEIEQQIVHRFRDFTFGTDKITLDISKYYTVLHIECINYESIDSYLIFFAEFAAFIHEQNEFLQVRRLGLRKVGTALYDTIEELKKDFEPKYFDFDFEEKGFNSLKRELRDLLSTKEEIRIDFRRGFEAGEAISEEGVKLPKYQA
ncbi:MAG: hypothetical protein EOO19_15090, partial [Chryseobacterium sp.]